MSLLKSRKPFTKPFWKLSSHRIPVLSLYKCLIKTTKLFPKKIHQKYLFYAIREKFRIRRHETSVTKTIEYLKEANEVGKLFFYIFYMCMCMFFFYYLFRLNHI